mmetsp:Transcript_71327/g.161318  ORF Transcript_71327/g.161318 Transcript_71327/m.161318 type:complete len:411 (+) Transcript_71327:109-1341(+)
MAISAELMSTVSMAAVATWTVSSGAHRALSTQMLLKESGEASAVIDEASAMLLPFISSATLLFMYLLFNYVQHFLVAYMVVVSFGSASMTLHGLLDSWPRVQGLRGMPALVAVLSAGLVGAWLLTSHWVPLDMLGVCMSVSVIALVRLPSLKVAAIVLCSLFVYDIFWVFFSARIFEDNVMVAVATRKADNPAQQLAQAAGVAGADAIAHTLQLPIKLMFPAGVSASGAPVYHMLGLGDMVVPGLFLAFALAFDVHLDDEHRRKDGHASGHISGQSPDSKGDEEAGEVTRGGGTVPILPAVGLVGGGVGGRNETRAAATPYFSGARKGYVAGLIVSMAASQIFGAAQPALLYLVPCVVAPLVFRARKRNHLGLLWRGFQTPEDDEEDSGEDTSQEASSKGVVRRGEGRGA